MARYCFDIETDGFIETLTQIHCLVLIDADTGEMISCTDTGPCYDSIEKGLKLLAEADEVIGHNIIKFDIPAIQKLHPTWAPKGRITDTLVCTRLIWSDLFDEDLREAQEKRVPGKLLGSHALKAWGYRLGVLKGDFGAATHDAKDGDETWATWTLEMHEYCEQDVRVTRRLLQRIEKERYSPEAIQLEHEFATVIAMMERNGFSFDETAAALLYTELVGKREALRVNLQAAFPPEVVEETFIPKRPNKKLGYEAGVPFIKRHTVEFNPGSRQMVGRRLQALGWVPKEFTASGQPKIDDAILAELDIPEAAPIAEYYLIEKRIGQIAEGDQAWLRLCRKGRIHGGVNTNGAVTGRCTHSNPNVAQVPKVGKPYGAQCRALFGARKGWKLVGADLSGLELRCLAHFMAKYDGGAYGKIILDGDIHWANVQALGLTDEARDDTKLPHKLFRDGAKTFIYAFLYGAGDQKIGSIIAKIIIAMDGAGHDTAALRKKFFGGNDIKSEASLKRAGKKLKDQFLKSLPALASLKKSLDEKVKKDGFILGLDKRRLHIRSPHAALNTLLQSAGALIAKRATVVAFRQLAADGLTFGKDWAFCAHIHDEIQTEAKPHLADRVGQTVVAAMRTAGESFGFRIQIDGEYKIGVTWYDTH